MDRVWGSRYLIGIAMVVAAFWLLERVAQLVYRIADILLIFGLAWLLKLLLDPMIRRMQRWHVPRPAAILVSYLLVIGGLVSGLLLLIPQLTLLTQRLPVLAQQLAAEAQNQALWFQERGARIDPTVLPNQIVGIGTTLARIAAQQAFTLAQSFIGVVGRIVLVITISIYMSLTADRLTGVIRPIIPPRWRDEFDAFIRDVDNTYSSYTRSYFYLVALGVLLSAVVLFGFRVPSAVLWLGAIALLRLLPFIGGALANTLLIVVLVFALPLPVAALAITLLLLAQAVLTHAIMPRVMGRGLGINPLVVLLAVLLGARIYGVAGVLFAVPAAAVISTVIGKAVKRYLLPLYETSGWWMADVPLTATDTMPLAEPPTQPIAPEQPTPRVAIDTLPPKPPARNVIRET